MTLRNDKIGVIPLPVNRLHIELTNFCNFACEFCPDSKMKRPRGFMDFDMLKGILDEVKERDIASSILFHVMGEPLLYPRLLDVIQYAKKKGIHSCITTNGALLNDELLDEMIKSGLNTIILSLQTPDDESFKMRGAKGVSFEAYAERIRQIAQKVIKNRSVNLRIDFLSSPLRRLIIPIAKEFKIADTSKRLKMHLRSWAEKILKDTDIEDNRAPDVIKQINRVRNFKENNIVISDNLSFHTRIVGDWSTHFDRKTINAKFGYCPALKENFGILWNGDYIFCCADFDGRTSICNYKQTSITDYLKKEVVQNVVKGFNSLRVIHPYCRQCIGDKNILNAFVKQIGSIVYFKWLRAN